MRRDARRPCGRGFALLCLLAAAAAGVPRDAAPGDTAAVSPLTNEDVVRLVMTRTPERDIRERIESGPVDFDLDPGVVIELRRAGVPDPIINLMRRRQAAMPRVAPEPTPAPAPADLGRLEVSFAAPAADRDDDARTALAVRTLPKTMTRRPGMEVGLVTDLALAILCTTADHVPDHWDSRSVLEGAPRHELLLFHPGSREETMKGLGILSLQPEPAYSVELPAGRHAIKVVLAGLGVGSSSWRLLAADGSLVRVVAGATTRLVIRASSRIEGSPMTGFRIDAEWKVDAVTEPDGAQADPTPAAAAPAVADPMAADPAARTGGSRLPGVAP